jgi:PAP2 superfamily
MAWESWKTATLERKLLLIVASMVWCLVLAWTARRLDLNEPYLALAIGGGLIFYFRSQPNITEQVAFVLLSIGFGLVVRFPFTKDWILAGSCMVALFGFGAFLISGFEWIWSNNAVRRQTIALFAPASALVFFVFSAQHALSLANLFYPKTYDLYLYAADGAFGLQPSFLFGQAMAASPVLRFACVLAYLLLPLVMALVYAVSQPVQADRASWDLLSQLMLAGMGGWILYNVLPATGPRYVFAASFPYHALPYHLLPKLLLEKVPVPDTVPRNAIPSLHLTWALLLYWNTKGMSRVLRASLAIYLALTVVSTLGTGEHYFVDLLAAVPFALLVEAVVSPGRRLSLSRRILFASYGLGLTLGWLLLARYGIKLMLISPAVPWGLSAVSCATVWMMNSRCGCGSLPSRPYPEANPSQSSTAVADQGLAASASH